MQLAETLAAVRVVPVIAIRDVADAVPLARALVAGGLSVIEITLRTDAALESIRRIATEVGDAVVGVGTVLTPDDLARAHGAGAQFAVSPGLTHALVDATRERRMPFLPGVATPSEIMQGLDAGLAVFKLFPAEAAGGVAMLKALAGPFPRVRFCPTGGVTSNNLATYLALPNVIAVGGSWMVPPGFEPERDAARVTALAREAAGAALPR
jgi:2-dehydro-3-deoxyphosphogluconate aldolase / (4S)-4-hydroxy-2-oxoglutarate aldolase